MIKKALAVFAILLTVSAQAQSRICANKVTGNILIRPTCFSSENIITNVAALKGPTGPIGPRGTQGLPGVQGPQGIQGLKGTTGTPGKSFNPVCREVQSLDKSTPDTIEPGQAPRMLGARIDCSSNEYLQSHSVIHSTNSELWEGDGITPTLFHQNDDPTKPIQGVGVGGWQSYYASDWLMFPNYATQEQTGGSNFTYLYNQRMTYWLKVTGVCCPLPQ